MAMRFTVNGQIELRDGENLVVKTDNNHEIFVLFAAGKLTVCNQSRVGISEDKANEELVLANMYDDGTIGVEEA